jgi:uncharacterized cysteine cluster protein YcgN (CxxCxxCC family)
MKRLSPFWQRKSLGEMTRREWEMLCAGCGRCCVLKLEDPRTLKVDYTNIACRFLDMETCRCTCYHGRKKTMPECLDLFHCEPEVYTWLPSSCAYRLLAEGHPLPAWHPLVSGDRHSTGKAGMSVRGHVVSEDDAWWAPVIPST